MFKRTVSLILCLCMAAGAILLTACAGAQTPSGTSDTESETVPEEIVIPEEAYCAQGTTAFAQGRQCLYTVVHQETPSDMYTDRAKDYLLSALLSCGIYAETKADTLPSFLKVEDYRLEREIVLGYTNRAESSAYDLGAGQYLYGMSEKGHIFILAQRSEDLMKVTQIFSEHVLPKISDGAIPLVPGFTVRFDERGRLLDASWSEESTPAPDEDEELFGWFDYGTALYMQKRFEKRYQPSISFSMARNEIEGFEYILTSDKNYAGLSVEVTPLTDGNGHTLDGIVYVAQYTDIKKGNDKYPTGYCPDALVPQSEEGFGFKAGQSQTLYIQYKTVEETVPGVYSGTLNVRQGDKILKTGKVELKVWDIYFDEKTECLTAFGNWWSIDPGYDNETRLKYYDLLVENRLSPYSIPAAYYSEEFDRRIRDPRVTSAMVSLDAYKYYQNEPDICEKMYAYPVDEPRSEDDLYAVLAEAERIHSSSPAFNLMTPFFKVVTVRDDAGNAIMDTMSVIEQTSNLMCPETYIFKGELKEWALRLKAERGTKICTYVAGCQNPSHSDFLAETPGTDKRILFWQIYQNDADGVLYWCVTWWEDSNYTTDGLLLYGDPETGDPIITLGLQSIRDGVEDFQLLRMAEKVLGKDAVMGYAERLSTAFNRFTTDENTLMNIREELFALMEGRG